MKKKGIVGILLMLCFVFVMTGCSSSSSSSSEKKDKTVVLGYQKGDQFHIAKIEGSLQKELESQGYTVKWKQFQDGPSMLEALNAGSIDYARTGDTPPITSQAAGSDIVYVGVGTSKTEGSGILVSNDSDITSVSDLKGKKVAFSKGSSSHYLLIKALEAAGLSYDDITPKYLKPGEARVAFENGDVDAWVVWDPYTAAAEVESNAKLLVDGDGLTTDRDFFLSTKKYAKSHTKLTATILEEVGTAMTWANENHDELIKELASALDMDTEVITKAVNRRTYGVDELTDDIKEEQQDIADTFYKLKLIPEKIDVSKAFLE